MKSSRSLTVILVVMALMALPMQAFASARGAAMAQMRRMYQDQMKQQMAEQKAIEQAEQQAAAAAAAEERRKHDAHVKANRARIERDARHREATIAKRKAENAAKENGGNVKEATKPKASVPK